MASLDESIHAVLKQDHPTLNPKDLSEGDNIIHEKNGTKFVATVKNGKIARLSGSNAEGKEGITVQIDPAATPSKQGPPVIKPDHILVCVCAPVSTAWGEGVRCWWYNND
jgi:hypothetical protein